MAELIVISQSQQALCDVVFVHGIRGDFRATWSSEAGYWPDWVAAENPSARVIAVSYSYRFSLFRPMRIRDHAVALLALLIANDVGTRPVVFVAHSLGGVIVKELLRLATTTGFPAYRSIWDQAAAVVFLATPIALPYFAFFPIFGLGRGTATDFRVLRDASEFYRHHAPRKGITTLAFAAAKSIVVAPYSSDSGVPDAVVVPLDVSDSEVAKPKSRQSLVVASVQRLLTNIQTLILERRLPAGAIGDDSIA